MKFSKEVAEYIRKFDASYEKMCAAYRRRIGRDPGESARNRIRKEIRQILAQVYPDPVRYVETYLKEISDYINKKGFGAGLPRTSQLSAVAQMGADIENHLRGMSVARIARIRKENEIVRPETAAGRPPILLTARYKELAQKTGSAPADSVAAILLGTTEFKVGVIRRSLEDELTFEANDADGGWKVSVKPPQPSQPASLQELVDGLGDDDKASLRELLASLRK